MEFFQENWGWFVILFITTARLGWVAVRNDDRPRIFTHPLNWALVAIGIILWLMQTRGVVWSLAGVGSLVATGVASFLLTAWSKYATYLAVMRFMHWRAERHRKTTSIATSPSEEGINYANLR